MHEIIREKHTVNHVEILSSLPTVKTRILDYFTETSFIKRKKCGIYLSKCKFSSEVTSIYFLDFGEKFQWRISHLLLYTKVIRCCYLLGVIFIIRLR